MIGLSGRTRLLCAVACFFFVAASFAATSRLHPPHKNQSGALRVTQVLELADREDILRDPNYDLLLASGLEDSDLQDGSLGTGKTFCCGKTDRGLAMYFYIPPDVEVGLGDIIEVRMGRKPKGEDRGELNTVTRVRVPFDEAESVCWWDPRNESLWRRVLYCRWMEEEGWILFTKGMSKAWLKPAGGNGQ
jgi:hypothetical protein